MKNDTLKDISLPFTGELSRLFIGLVPVFSLRTGETEVESLTLDGVFDRWRH